MYGVLYIFCSLSDTIALIMTPIYQTHHCIHSLIDHCRFTQNFTSSSKMSMPVGKVCFAQKLAYFAVIMCLMLLLSYYAQNYE